MKTTINKVKEGTFVRFKDSETAHVWIRGYYERGSKKYELYSYNNTNKETFKKGNTICYIDFEF